MKKTLLTLIGAAAMVASSYAQGTISFVNDNTQLIRIEGVSAALAAGAKVEILGAPAGTTDLGLFTLAGAAVNVGTPVAGRFSGGIRTISNIPAGGAAAVIIRGYVGTSWEAATTRGSSAILNFASTGNPTTVPAGTSSSLASGGFSGLNLTIVPEPSSMALAGLGAAALVLFRRRK